MTMPESGNTEHAVVAPERVSRFKVLGIAAIGGLACLCIQAYGNDKAADRIATAVSCEASVPEEQKLSKAFIDCVEAGLDGDGKIKDEFDVGDPVSDVNDYVERQQDETDFKPWLAVASAVGAGFLGYMVIVYRSDSSTSV